MPAGQTPEACPRPRAIVVDDDPVVVELLRFLLDRDDWQVEEAGSYTQALILLTAASADLLIVEIGLPEGDGVAFCALARRLHQGLIVSTSRSGSGEERLAGLLASVDEHLIKPLDAAELLARLQALQRRRAWLREEQRLKRSSDVANHWKEGPR